jgi:peptidoglycan/LPS O-acetylase OafA/YrhL
MKLLELDGLRALAVGLVFLLHLTSALRRELPALARESGWLLRLCGSGGVGVALFFAVSGFLVGLPFAQNRPFERRSYARRRFFRIVPPYWVALGAAFAGQLALGWVSTRELLPSLLASIFFVHNALFGAWSRVLPVAWSLEIEVQFYFLVPLLGRLYRLAHAEWILTGLAFLGAALSALLNPLLSRLHLDRSLLSDGHFFVLGMALAARFVRRGELVRSAPLWDVAGAGGLFAMLLLWGRPGPAAQLVALIGILALFLSALHGRVGPTLARFFAPLGERCYSLYLLHYPLLALGLGLTKHLPQPSSSEATIALHAALLVPPVLLTAELFHRIVERPCQKYGKKQKVF